MKRRLLIIRSAALTILGAASWALLAPTTGRGEEIPTSDLVRNGGFNARGALPPPYFNQQDVAKLRGDGWTCPDIAAWPQWWSVYGKNGTVEFPQTGGVKADGYARLSGQEVYLCGYDGHVWDKRNRIYTIWARGQGQLVFHAISYGMKEDGNAEQVSGTNAVTGTKVAVNSAQWIRYRHLLLKTPRLWAIQPWPGVENGALDIDEVDIVPSTPALDLIVAEEEKLCGTGALIENLTLVKVDNTFRDRVKAYQEAVAAFRQAGERRDKELAASLDAGMRALAPYVLTENLSAVQAIYYNEMIALTRVLKTLAGQTPIPPAPVTAQAVAVNVAADYKAGVRPARKDAVMITAIETDKILYEEGENAVATVTITNTAGQEQKLTLTAVEVHDLDQAREVGRGSVAVPAGGATTWTVRYNVGPETYGRAIEVRAADSAGKELDRWQEYYQVAREWFRVQMHSDSRYQNMNHFFESEPTDWGVQPTTAEVWKSSAGYDVNPAVRLAQVRYWHARGKKFTFYQNNSFSGIMGYEEMRKHPEYVLHDPNGQFAVDPTYSGYPNPMELASPIEIGPQRKPVKPYLDRSYTGWQHASANFADEDVVEYGARSIRDYAKKWEFDGVFIDAQIAVIRGYGYDGRMNVPADLNKIARVNARIQNLYSRVLKEEHPYFGTWYNYSVLGLEYYRHGVWPYGDAGAGFSPGESDAWIRALNSWKNSACLMEWAGALGSGEGPERHPQELLEALCTNRDDTVQKYGGNTAIGYFQGANIEALSGDRSPGPSKWSWPTINYFMAQLMAAQHHIIMCVRTSPSMEPTFQFQTRCSRFLWAPDIKVVPAAEKTVTVKSPEELRWKPFVYRCDRKNGYDLIVHLVRIPPYAKWDLDWVDEPVPLEGVKMSVRIGRDKVEKAMALRPYQFEEDQQVVEQTLTTRVAAGKATVTVPPFRYHTMVVIRMVKRGWTGGPLDQ